LVVNLRWTSAQTLVAVLSAVALIVAVQVSAPLAIRVPLGLVVAVIMPGFLGFRAVRRRVPNTLADAAVGLIGSVGILVVLGIALNLLPTGLTPTSWAIALTVLLTVLGAVGDYRREAPEPIDFVKPRRARRGSWLPRRLEVVRTGQLLFSIALLCTGAAITVNSQYVESDSQHLTEMWIVSDGDQHVVHVRNEEGTAVNYEMVTSVVDGVDSTTRIRLTDGAEWTTTIVEPPRLNLPASTPFPVSVSLYRGDEESVYRQVRINRPPA
jgi:uncharacterized membrane protein